MDKSEKKYSFEKPRCNFEDSPLDDRLVILETKFSRLTVWTSVLTFLLLATVIAAVIVQILLNSNAPTEDSSTAVPLARYVQRQAAGACCQDLEQKLAVLEERFQDALLQLNQNGVKIAESPLQPHHAPKSDFEHKHSQDGYVPPEISSEIFVEKGIEYDYPQVGSGDDSFYLEYPNFDSDGLNEIAGSGIGNSLSDDEDLTGQEGSGCRAFARPVCSDGCITDIIQGGCPVPICCNGLPEPDNKPHHHHHHHH